MEVVLALNGGLNRSKIMHQSPDETVDHCVLNVVRGEDEVTLSLLRKNFTAAAAVFLSSSSEFEVSIVQV